MRIGCSVIPGPPEGRSPESMDAKRDCFAPGVSSARVGVMDSGLVRYAHAPE